MLVTCLLRELQGSRRNPDPGEEGEIKGEWIMLFSDWLKVQYKVRKIDKAEFEKSVDKWQKKVEEELKKREPSAMSGKKAG